MTHEVMRAMAEVDEVRFHTPLYSLAEAARHLAVPASTFTTWARGYVRNRPGRKDSTGAVPTITTVGRPVVTTVGEPSKGVAVVPFIGLAEGFALAAFRSSGVPLQRIRPALDRLAQELGMRHALASRALYTDGAEVLYDYAEASGNTPEARAARELVVVRNDQRVFTQVVASYLHRVEFASDGYARLIHLPQYQQARVIVDATRGFGQPVFEHGGARVDDALALFGAGEPLDVVSAEYGVPEAELEDAVRVALQHAA